MMEDKPNIVEIMVNQAADTIRKEWFDLVGMATRLTKDTDSVEQTSEALFRATGKSKDSIARKIYAIHHAQVLGHGEEEISKMGESKTLSLFQRKKKEETYEIDVWMRFKVKGSQRELVQREMDRVRRILNLSIEEYFDWWLSQMQQATDQDIRDSGQKGNF